MRKGLTAWRTDDVNVRSAPQMREYELVASRIAADAPANVLDWGCGHGQVSDLLISHGLDVTSYDYRAEIERDGLYPMARFPAISAYLSADPVTLPFASASFDAVLSCGVLEHVVDPDASLEEIRRVLRPGGTFYVFKLPNRYSYIEKLSKWCGTYYHGKEPNDRVYSLTTAVTLLQRHGFSVREQRRANMVPLNATGHLLKNKGANAVWTMNRGLSRVPVLSTIATNLEFVAQKPADPPG